MHEVILGIDPGTAICGWGIIQKNLRPRRTSLGLEKQLELVDYGCIITSKDSLPATRLLIIYKEFKKLIKLYKPIKISIESIFFFKNLKTAVKIAEVRGVILLIAAEFKLPIIEVTPLQVKQAVCGYGRAEKIQVQKMVQKLLNLKETPKPDDAADALAAAIYASFTKV